MDGIFYIDVYLTYLHPLLLCSVFVPLATHPAICTHTLYTHTLHCTIYTVYCTLYNIHTHCTVQYTLYTANCTLYTLHCTRYTVHCTIYRYQAWAIFGIQRLLVPAAVYVCLMHLNVALTLLLDPYNTEALLSTFLSVHFYVWARISYAFFRRTGIMVNYSYSLSIFLASVLVTPTVSGPLGNMYLILYITVFQVRLRLRLRWRLR